jgi:hypothetical protein
VKIPELPDNIGKRRRIKDIRGNPRYFVIVDEIRLQQSTQDQKAIYLQQLQFEEDGGLEFRLGYYMISKKPRFAGRWVWGQYATMMPVNDFQEIIHLAKEKGWLK